MMEKIIIGKPFTKKDILQILLTNTLFIIVYFGSFYMMLGIMMKYYFNENVFVSSFFALIISFPILLSLSKIILSGSLGWQYLEVNENYLIFNEKKELKDGMDEAKAILKGSHYPASIQIQLNDLVSVKINATSRLGMWVNVNAILVLECCLSDGSMVQIMPEALKSNAGDYQRVLDYLENRGVYILDPYHLREALNGDYMDFQEYVIKHKKGKWR